MKELNFFWGVPNCPRIRSTCIIKLPPLFYINRWLWTRGDGNMSEKRKWEKWKQNNLQALIYRRVVCNMIIMFLGTCFVAVVAL